MLKSVNKIMFFFPITSNNLGEYTVCLVFSLSLVILSISVHLSVIRQPIAHQEREITIQSPGFTPTNAVAPAFKHRIPLPPLSCLLT